MRDFYVKWNLKLPDAITPTSVVTDAESWNQACGQFNNKLYDCPEVQINYKKKNGKMELIPSACKISGNLCIVNDAVAVSRGEDEKALQKIIVIVKPGSLPKPKDKQQPEHKEKSDDSMNGMDYDGWYPGGVYAEHAYDGSKSSSSSDKTGNDKTGGSDKFVKPDQRQNFNINKDLLDSYNDGVKDTGTVPGDPFAGGNDKFVKPDLRQDFDASKYSGSWNNPTDWASLDSGVKDTIGSVTVPVNLGNRAFDVNTTQYTVPDRVKNQINNVGANVKPLRK